MSDPTPLSAEAARAMTLLVMASRVDSNLRSAVADVETYVAELQREIEGYRQALESIRDNPHRSDPKAPEVRPRCPKCHQEIDPDVCWCGDMMEPSSHGDHYAIPMGCRCHFARGGIQ